MSKKSLKSKRPAAEKAFTESDKHVLDGIKLKPWTPSRVIAGQAMGVLFPNIGDEGWDQFNRTSLYAGALKDTIIVLWLCTLRDEEVDSADVAPVEAYKKARAWAVGLGLHNANSKQFWQAYVKFTEIMGEVTNSTTFRKADGPSEEEPDDPNG